MKAVILLKFKIIPKSSVKQLLTHFDKSDFKYFPFSQELHKDEEVQVKQ